MGKDGVSGAYSSGGRPALHVGLVDVHGVDGIRGLIAVRIMGASVLRDGCKFITLHLLVVYIVGRRTARLNIVRCVGPRHAEVAYDP